ncbi:hypothetical protein [Pseudoalteromonas sp. Of11M-6]|uniref:hypothetical protein n=1 Tax=Pseudoalteromonas sp. Of11M-6 TaxID=2917754 RepID=UPI001EF451EC|nr:hypothetical protein [Pseudoalteromonas sp. Of11M-6]MCG7552041.1 hypothetical protein [Pseudoalteromonas sp. Of11M-6]
MPVDEKSAKGILTSLLSFADKDTKELINIFLFMFVPMGFMLLLMGGMKLIDKIDEPNEACWAVEKVEKQIFKINKCTGETELLEVTKDKSKSKT